MSNALTVFTQEVNKQKPKFANVLPAHLSPDRLAQTAVAWAGMNPYLLEKCDRGSVWRSIYTAAVFGLEIDGRQGAIVPFKGKAQFIPMVAGLVTLAHNSGYKLTGQVVRSKDEFDYTIEPPMIRHKRPAVGSMDAELRDEHNPLVAAYATARRIGDPPSEPPLFEVMTMADIFRVRDKSQGYQMAKEKGRSSPWMTDFEAMCRKTPIRSLANHLPLQVQKAIELEARHDNEGAFTWAEKYDGKIDVHAEQVVEGEAEVVSNAAL